MIRHIVMWNFQETLNEEQKKEAAKQMVKNLEPLKDKIPGVISLQIIPNELESSNREIALIGDYESVEALKAYAVHPLHLEAVAYVKSVCCDRIAFDYEL